MSDLFHLLPLQYVPALSAALNASSAHAFGNGPAHWTFDPLVARLGPSRVHIIVPAVFASSNVRVPQRDAPRPRDGVFLAILQACSQGCSVSRATMNTTIVLNTTAT